jgi:hypothetical protein
MEGEIWKDIKGYEGFYQVSNMGRIKSLSYGYTKKPKIMKQFKSPNDYLKVSLYKGKPNKNVRVHRLVAETFIKNPENKRTVDHINTIRTDNRVCNLKWATSSEQLNNNPITREKIKITSSRIGKMACKFMKEANKKKVRCLTTGKEFNSIKEASEYYNVPQNGIGKCCKGKQKHTGKFKSEKLAWEYIN